MIVRKVMIGIALGIICLGWVVIVVYGTLQLIYVVKLSNLNSEVYTLIKEPAGTDTSSGPYLKGKVVVIDRNKRELDGLHRAVPATLRAENVNQVGTIIWLEWDYQWNKQGLRYPVCKVTVIDRARNVIVGQTTIEGMPASNLGRPGGLRSIPAEHRPNAEVARYIKNLPRR